MGTNPRNLSELLHRAADHASEKGLRFYQVGSHGGADTNASIRLTYSQLRDNALVHSEAVRQCLAGCPLDTVVVLVFNNQYENVLWFWAVVLAGFIPCISQPLSNDLRQRREYFLHLDKLFSKPLFLTTSTLVAEFLGLDTLTIQEVESIPFGRVEASEQGALGAQKAGTDTAAFMLTSGSSGNQKGVVHQHQQMLESVQGKAMYHQVTHDDIFLNWIGLDHDANLTETHLQAMWLISEQVHVHKDDVISAAREGPLLFLKLLSKHQVTHTFAPHGFLDAVRLFLEKRPSNAPPLDINLSPLRNWISGGERNVVASVNTLTDLLQRYGAPKNLIRPGFGMTETCAGSIYSRRCPEADLATGKEHAMLGQCIQGIEMRIVINDKPVGQDVSGDLQVKGPIVTTGYYNNPEANEESFTDDGWFRTGDIAMIDPDGFLVITGRAKDDIIINGLHHHIDDIQSALNEAKITGLTTGYNVVFSHRPPGAPTETICMVYLPTYDMEDVEARVDTLDKVGNVIVKLTGSLPYKVIPLPAELLQKSSLGKLSNKKIAKSFEAGEYDQYFDEQIIQEHRNKQYAAPTNEIERKILDVLKNYEGSNDNFGIDSNIFQKGMDSIKLIDFQTAVEASLGLPYPVKLTDILENQTPRKLAHKVSIPPDGQYNPQAILQSQGTKKPLWLIHPGMGEILIFLPLSAYFEGDRPVYALRPKGLEGGEHFKDIPEAARLYYETVIKAQPTGPYALLGYSFGGSMAFEVGKLLEASGREARFVGVIDQPPQLKANSMRADWYGCLVALSGFLELLADATKPGMLQRMRDEKPSREDAVQMIVVQTTKEKMNALGLTNKKLQNWASVAYRLKEIGRDYDPEGKVKDMDVFYVKFRPYRAKDDADWLNVHLGEWQEHVRNPVKFHFCEGTHYDMITTHKESFQERLKKLLSERGL